MHPNRNVEDQNWYRRVDFKHFKYFKNLISSNKNEKDQKNKTDKKDKKGDKKQQKEQSDKDDDEDYAQKCRNNIQIKILWCFCSWPSDTENQSYQSLYEGLQQNYFGLPKRVSHNQENIINRGII